MTRRKEKRKLKSVKRNFAKSQHSQKYFLNSSQFKFQRTALTGGSHCATGSVGWLALHTPAYS